MDEEAAAKQRAFFKRRVDRDCGLWNHMFVVDVGGDTDNAVRRGRDSGDELQHGVRPINMAIDGIVVGEHAVRESLTDDHHRIIRLAVEIIEITSSDNRSTERGKESRRDDAQLRSGIFARSMNVTISGKLETGTKTGVAPRDEHAKRSFVDAR